MRLQEIFFICKTVQASWADLDLEEIKAAGNATYFKVRNADYIRKILSTLEPIDAFSKNISSIKSASLGFMQSSGEITVDQRVKTALVSEFKTLESKVTTLTELFESLNYQQNSNGFDIKLPSNISLSDLSKCTKDLNTIFTICPLFANSPETISFSSVDVGSVWLSFLIGGAVTIGLLDRLAKLVDKVIIIRSHWLSCKEQEALIRRSQLDNDFLENSQKATAAVVGKITEKVCQELADEYSITDNEDLSRLSTSVNLLFNWMNKGMEIHASIQAPPDAKAVFPPVETQKLPESVISLLTDGNLNNDDSQ